MPERGTKSSDCVEASEAAAARARRAPRSEEGVTVPISLETAPGSEGLVFIAALKQGSVFILGGFQIAFRVKCKPADVCSYYPPQRSSYLEQRAHRTAHSHRSNAPKCKGPIVLLPLAS